MVNTDWKPHKPSGQQILLYGSSFNLISFYSRLSGLTHSLNRWFNPKANHSVVSSHSIVLSHFFNFFSYEFLAQKISVYDCRLYLICVRSILKLPACWMSVNVKKTISQLSNRSRLTLKCLSYFSPPLTLKCLSYFSLPFVPF